jgi:hypothetical protein
MVTYKPKLLFTGTDSFTITVKDKEGKTSDPATVTVTVGQAGGFINEVVRNEFRLEIFNPDNRSLDITDWKIAGYKIGSDPSRESYTGPSVDGRPPSAAAFHAGTYLVVHIPGANLTTGTLKLTDTIGKVRDALKPDLTCYPNSRQLRPSLSRYLDGFDAGDPCLSFRWMETSTLGASN